MTVVQFYCTNILFCYRKFQNLLLVHYYALKLQFVYKPPKKSPTEL